MSSWPDKYVIGLTGNIATGKSIVRKMLEHMGAYGIDADALSHRVLAKGGPGYQPIVDYFGRWVVGSDGQIDRAKLGRVVFSDPAALAKLESVVHPYVRQAVEILAKRAKQPVIVIEAIKLLEGDLRAACDAIWVTDASPRTQFERLRTKRKMSQSDARLRIENQAAQADKLTVADVVIKNEGSFENSWRQVVAAWKEVFPAVETGPTIVAQVDHGKLTVQRATPRLATEIAAFITHQTDGQKKMTRTDVMEAFGEKAFMMLMNQEKIVGLVGWQVENLVSRVVDLYFDKSLSFESAIPDVMKEVEKASMELQSEASLLFISADFAQRETLWKSIGYERRTVSELNVRAWQEAAKESAGEGTVMLFKQLRVDRILRPI